MKNIFDKIKGFCKTYRKRLIIGVSTCVLIVIIATGVIGRVVYSRAKSNIKYTQEQLQKIALGKVPGEVVAVEKELNFEEAVYEYDFKIKDKENMLQTIKLDSQYGVILSVNDDESNNQHNEKSNNEDNERHGEDQGEQDGN